MVDMGAEIHEMSQQPEDVTQEVVNDYLDFEDFKANIGVAQDHDFDPTKRRFIKVYLDLALPPYNLLDHTSVTVKYYEYDDNSSIKKNGTSLEQ